MAIFIKDFSGNLNLDASPFRMPSQDLMHALNITRNADGQYADGPVSNIRGNRKGGLNYTLPSGDNICIGAKSDEIRGRVICFIYNSESKHSILSYSVSDRTLIKIFESKTDSAGEDILGLTLVNKVNDIEIIHRDEDGDLLFWNDGNTRPGGLNIQDFINGLYTPVPAYAIRLAKRCPLDSLQPVYMSIPSLVVNNFKGKLFQYKYRWTYKNGYKSTWSPSSKMVLPEDAYNVVVESDPTKNNGVSLQLFSGPVDYQKIELAVRLSVGGDWGDWQLVDSLDRDDYDIPPNSTYQYIFLNDGAYVDLDVRESDLLFDWVPDKANAMTLVNGNVLMFAGITDGYNPIRRAQINVQITSTLIDSAKSGTNPSNPTIRYTLTRSDRRNRVNIYVGTDIGEGTVYRIKFRQPIYEDLPNSLNVDVSYTATATDTSRMVSDALANKIIAQASGYPTIVEVEEGNWSSVNGEILIRVLNDQNVFSGNNYQFDNVEVSATPLILKSGAQPTWKWNSKYRLGLVYLDEYGKTNGVISYVGSIDDPSDFSFTTPDFAISTTAGDTYLQPKIPIVTAAISHTPPSWAARYLWVRTVNQAASFFLQYVTCEVEDDANYYYLCIANLNAYRTDNTGFVPSYVFQTGDRVRIMCNADVVSGEIQYISNTFTDDYEILGTVQKPVNNSDTVSGTFIKISKVPGGRPFGEKMLIEIYRPYLRNNEKAEVFYEFGESYPIYTENGNRYHVGKDQNQTQSQPATFTFEDGDVYYKFRNFYTNTLSIGNVYQLGVMDANYSDFYSSAFNSNGRAFVVDVNAKKTYNPVLKRFGQPFLPGTDINGLNRFYPEDFDEDNRSFGDIMKMIQKDNVIISFQKLKVGFVPVLQQMTYNVDGSSNLILSSNLINKIQYYTSWQGGIGDCAESVAIKNSSVYWWDNIRGVCCRLSQNGITPISISGNINGFAFKEARTRGVGSKIYGVFDSENNIYISAMETVPDVSEAKTLVWNDRRNGFESFVSYTPEMMCYIDNVLITWKEGMPYTHDDGVFNRFYNVDYESSVSLVFGDAIMNKKSWNNVTVQATEIWDVPYISTASNSSSNGQKQESNILESEFDEKEGFYHAALLADKNSIGGVYNGASLKGAYLIGKFRRANATKLVTLNAVAVGVADSPLNNKQ